MSFGVVAGIHVAQPLEALHQQRRADEQHERERGLPDDEQRRGPSCRRPVLPRPPRAGALRSGDDARSAGTTPHASATSTTSTNAAASVGRSSRRAASRGMPSGAARRKSGSVTRAQHNGEHAGRQRDQERLGHLQPHELRARRADRAAHRQVAASPFGAHQEQVGDVGAGDEQHDGHRAEQHPQRRAWRVGRPAARAAGSTTARCCSMMRA